MQIKKTPPSLGLSSSSRPCHGREMKLTYFQWYGHGQFLTLFVRLCYHTPLQLISNMYTLVASSLDHHGLGPGWYFAVSKGTPTEKPLM